MPIPSIRVLPNPSFVCDADGNPSCAIPLPDAPQSFVGAVRTFVPKGGDIPNHPGQLRGTFRFTFDTSTPVEIFGAEAVATIARHVRDGELLPADELTAKRCGVPWNATKPTPKASAQPSAGA